MVMPKAISTWFMVVFFLLAALAAFGVFSNGILTGLVALGAAVFLFLGRLELAAVVGLMDTFFKIFVYIGHERLWNRIRYGREQQQPEYVI